MSNTTVESEIDSHVTINAKIDEFDYTEKELKRLQNKKPELFPTFPFTVNEDFLESLNDFCKDHKQNFDCLPTEFAYEGMVFDFDDFINLVDEKLL
tara:strand:+ start:9921 stop:10208 length:288 start_codon:yes stop_codon:yes gene_type:complete